MLVVTILIVTRSRETLETSVLPRLFTSDDYHYHLANHFDRRYIIPMSCDMLLTRDVDRQYRHT